MTDLLSWNVTVIGAVLCLLYCWFLAVLGRSQKVRFGKIVTVLGIVGTLVLAGMAFVGPLHNPEFEGRGTMSAAGVIVDPDPNVIKGTLDNVRRLDLVNRAVIKLGPKPSKEHLPWKYPDGRLAWVAKDEYIRLRTEQRKGEK